MARMARRKMYRLIGSVVASAALIVAGLSGTPAFAKSGTGDPTRMIKDRYLVVFKKDTSTLDLVSARLGAVRLGGLVHFTYSAALKGFAATLPAPAVEALRHNRNVAFVEADRVIELDATQSPVTWGLDRIDQRSRPLSNGYTYHATGAGVKAYIIDTGIRFSHSNFGGRAVSGHDAVDGGSADDCHGHGTHVAGTVGSSTYGVAKGVQLVGVRVLNCSGSGTTSQVVRGIDWVTADHAAGQPAVANMSLGGSASSAIDTAVNNSIADGVTYAVAAGNGNILGLQDNACSYSPARAPAAITVSATDSSDRKASWANYGTCLDIFAPGVSISSTWSSSDTATKTISGTSMATPHVAGAAALYLQGNPSASPQAVRDQLVNTATTGVVSSSGTGSPNRLLYTLGALKSSPSASGCASLPQVFTGSLSGTGDVDIHPDGTSYTSTGSGTHRGCLDGPDGVDFDLYLHKWNGSSWARVASSVSSGPDEEITYSGTPGDYRWRVHAYQGSGSYTFGMRKP